MPKVVIDLFQHGMKLSVKMWSLHARVPECTMLIIAKTAGLCLPINKQTIPSTEQPSFGRCRGTHGCMQPLKAAQGWAQRRQTRRQTPLGCGLPQLTPLRGMPIWEETHPTSFKWKGSEYSFLQGNCRTFTALPGKECSYRILLCDFHRIIDITILAH